MSATKQKKSEAVEPQASAWPYRRQHVKDAPPAIQKQWTMALLEGHPMKGLSRVLEAGFYVDAATIEATAMPAHRGIEAMPDYARGEYRVKNRGKLESERRCLLRSQSLEKWARETSREDDLAAAKQRVADEAKQRAAYVASRAAQIEAEQDQARRDAALARAAAEYDTKGSK